MKQTKRTLAILLAVLLLALSMPFAAVAEDATSGSCGTDATWNYDAATKTLTISGTGATNGYSTPVDKRAPWFALEADITTVVVEEGITALGNQFLWHNTSDPCAVKTISLPETLTSLGNHSFCNCSELETVNLPKSLVSIGVSVFSGCSSLSTIPYAGTVADWSNVTVDASSGLDISKVTFHTHAYANPVFDWNSTGEGEATVWSATKATFTCECDATIDIEATVTPVTTNPKCEDAGSTVYTATATPTAETYGEGEDAEIIGTFANATYEDTKTVVLGQTGHTFPLTAHEKVDATCMAAGTEAYWECSACHLLFSDAEGKNKIDNPIEIPQEPHNFVKGEGAVMQHNEDNTHSYKCKDCNTFGDSEACTIGDWEDGTVTCTASGTEVKKCSVCGGVCETREATAKGHIYTGKAINNNDATDESEGTHTMTCKYCGKRSVEKNPHQWNNGTVELAPTCMSDGTKVFTCTVPGCDATKEQAISKTGHDFYDLKTEKEKNKDGSYTVTASAYCKTEKQYIEEESTATLKVDEPATCQKLGKGHYEATFTKGFFAETDGLYTFEINNGVLPVDPAAHDLVKVSAVEPTCKNGGNGGNEAYWRCKICGDLFADVAGAEGEESTAGDKINEAPLLPALTHTPVTTTENVVAATCTVAGSYDEVVTCSRCGDLISRTHHDGEMLKHQLTEKGTSATCTEDGIDTYWECSECEQKFSDEKATDKIDTPVTIPKLGHNFTPAEDENGKISNIVPNSDKTHSFTCKNKGCNAVGAVINGQQTEGGKIACSFSGEWVDDPEHTATCQESGIQYKACDSQCGNKQEQTIDTRLHNFSVPKALGDHTQEAEGAGFHAYYCSYDCGQYDVQRKEAHKWTAWQDLETDPTTCSHLGKITRKCSVCGLTEEKDAPEKLAHTFPEEKSYDVVAKTTDAGTTYTVNAFTACSKCHEIFTDEVVAAVVVTEGKEPTCSATGEGTYVAKFKAPFEDYTILDEDRQPVTAEIAIDPDAHQLTPVAKKEATCEEDGYEAYWQCGLCDKLFKAETATADDVIEAPIVIGKLNHSYTKKTVNDNTLYAAVTCTQAAKYYYSCARCDAIENNADHTFTDGDALGHDFSGAYQNVADGTHNRKCSRCEAYGIGTTENATEACSGGTATCTEKAVCKDCNTAYGNVDSTNHNWVENAAENYLKAAADCTNPAEYYKSCSRCGTTNKEATFTVGSALGHDWSGWEYLNETYHQHSCANDPDDTHPEKQKHVVAVKTIRNADPDYPTVKTHCQEVKYCTVCGAVLEVLDEWTETAQHQHEYTSVVTKEPNCTYEGERTFTCQICGNVVTESIATNGAHADADNDGYCDYCKNMMTGGDHCPQCGKIHNGGFGDRLTGFFHRIAAFFTRLFR